MSTVSIGCKLPNGIVLELGYVIRNGQIVNLPEYRRVVLAGSEQSRMIPGVTNLAPSNFVPGITENVDEEFFDKWCLDHADSNIVKNKLIYKMKNNKEAVARGVDETQRKIGFEPLPQTNLGAVSRRTDDNNDGFGSGFTAP